MLNSKKTIYGCYIHPNILSLKKTVLSDSGKILLSKIIVFSQNKTGYCYAGNQHLAKELGKTKEQITRGVTKLTHDHFLERHLIRDIRGEVVRRELTLTSKTDLLVKNSITPTLKIDTTPPTNNDELNINKDKFNNDKKKKGTSRSLSTSFEDYSKKYDISDLVTEILKYYLNLYEQTRNQKHPNLREDQWLEIANALETNTEEYDLEIDGWETIIDAHFSTKYQQGCDFNLLHFISPKILEHRYYEKIYR